MNGFIYARQSSGGTETSLSIDVQIENCKRYATKEGINIVEVFSDYNTSGRCFPVGAENVAERDLAFQRWYSEKTTPSKQYRSGLGSLFKRLHEVDVIIIDDITRLYRPLSASFLESYIHQNLILNKIKIHTVKGGIINTETFNDSLILSIQNQVESQAILVRTQKSKASLKKLKDEGWTVGGKALMLGYTQLGKQRYEINKDEEMAIKKLFELLKEGYSYEYITSYINKNYKMPRRNDLQPTHVKRIASRPEYCGMCYNSKNELIESKCFGHIPLVSKTEWFKVQDVLKSKPSKTREKKGNVYTLTGMLKCGYCGKPLMIHSAGQFKYFSCRDTVERMFHQKIRYESADQMFCYHELRDNLFGLSYFGQMVCIYEATYPLLVKVIIDEFLLLNNNSDMELEINQIKLELEKIEKHEKKLSAMLLNETIDDDQFTTMAKTYKHQRDELKRKLNALTESLYKSDESINFEVLFKEFIVGEMDDKKIKVFIHKVVDFITVFDDKITITMKDGKEFDLPRISFTKTDRLGRSQKTLPTWEVYGELYGTSKIVYHTGERKTLYESQSLKIVSE